MTVEEIIRMYQKGLEASRYSDKEFNRRWFDPFHLFNYDYNPNNVEKISEEVYRYHVIRNECLTCTGKYDPRPMPCWNSEECKMNFRYRDKRQPFSASGIIETKQKFHESPYSILISRPLLVYNYYHNHPIIIRTTKWTDLIIHHLNIDKHDDSNGNHILFLSGEHTSFHRKLIGQMNFLKELEDMKNDSSILVPENNMDTLIEAQNKKIERMKDLRPSDEVSFLISFMVHHSKEIMEN